MRIVPNPLKMEMAEGALQAARFCVTADDQEILRFADKFSGGETKLTFQKAEFAKAESYTLTVCESGIAVTYSDLEAAFRACSTLKQILAQTAGEIPCLHMEDSPAIKIRGYMLDISRGKVPKLAYLKTLADQLADLRYNQFQLYIDAPVYSYKGLEKYLTDRDVLTCEEIQELDTYCKERFIDLVPNQNSLGHMESWVKMEDFAPLGIQRDDGQPTTTIDPLDPRSLEFVDRLYGGMMDAYSSKLINVGMDEPFELGMGQTKEACEKYGTGTVYTDYLNKIIALAKKYGKMPMFWDDVAIKHPEQLERIDKDAIFLDWGYETEKLVERRCRKLSELGLRFYVCPGSSAWCSFTGRSMNAVRNITTYAELAKTFGAEGFLMTEWGNLGNAQFPAVAQIPMVFAAIAAWEPDDDRPDYALDMRSRRTKDAIAYTDRYLYNCKGEVSLADIVFRMGGYCHVEDQYHWNETELAYFIRTMDTPDAAKIAGMKRVASYMESLKAELANVDADETSLQEITVDCDIVIYLANYFAGKEDKQERQRVLDAYERTWLQKNYRQGMELFADRVRNLP